MRRRSSGSSGEGDSSPVEAPLESAETRPLAPDSQDVDRHSKPESRPAARSRRSGSSINWKPSINHNVSAEKLPFSASALPHSPLHLVAHTNGSRGKEMNKHSDSQHASRRPRCKSPWSITVLAILTSFVGIGLLVTIITSSVTRQRDPKGCRMSYMRPSYTRLKDFDTEHTRFASKYSLYLYREEGIDLDNKVRGVPVLFIPGNAGSYKQVRPIAAETAAYFHHVLLQDEDAVRAGMRKLDFFTVDFNEDITAFHGQTLIDQAEYLNEAIRYILSLYLDPRVADRDADLPDPSSVILLGHSMGGIVARTMLIMPNYQAKSINTILTISAPHARPPVSFDRDIVRIYGEINDYWRRAYSQKWANDNPLWHVTLVSIAGGGLDTVVPSDYASVESLVPDTHGFTVFTSTVPTVWTSMDHLAILWCDQFRKVITRALYEIVDVHRPTQTKPRAERMRIFKKSFLTGLEAVAERTVPSKEPSTLLVLGGGVDERMASGDRLVLRSLGSTGMARAHLMPIPPPASPGRIRFSLLTDQRLDETGGSGKLEVLLCALLPLNSAFAGQTGTVFAATLDLSGDEARSTRLACKNAAADTIPLPASTRSTPNPFYLDDEREISPFSYIQYDADEIAAHQFVAIVEKASAPMPGFVIAEFNSRIDSHLSRRVSAGRMLAVGMKIHLSATRPMVTELSIPSIQSSLLAFHLEIGSHACGEGPEMFTALVRQYLTEPHESKFFVNASRVDVSLHGLAPYVPPPLRSRGVEDGSGLGSGLGFQFWSDPTCNASIDLKLTIDLLGSLGKLYMRYRTVCAAFPLLVVALVLRKQFRTYDTTGVFISFSDGLDLSLTRPIPVLLLALTLLSGARTSAPVDKLRVWSRHNGTAPTVDFGKNDLLVGTEHVLLSFLVPLIGIVSVGICTLVNYSTLALTHGLSMAVAFFSHRPGWMWNANAERRKATSSFVPSSPRRRIITTAILLLLVSTLIPYQFAYLVACLVQLTTAVRAQGIASDLRSTANCNFFNYVHSILILMLWLLPINLPVLVVWVHNLAVHWLTPFATHHNVLSIMPFLVLVETLTTGKMVPRLPSRSTHVTSLLLYGISLYAAVYGVSYAYGLHHLVNLLVAWLVLIHSSSGSWSFSSITDLYRGMTEDRKRGKEP